MDPADYTRQIKQTNILGYNTLTITLKEVKVNNDTALANEIERILKNNQIIKPALHSRPNDLATTYYKIDLLSDQIRTITEIFLDLEASFVNEKGETTAMSSFYATLCDEWNRLIEY